MAIFSLDKADETVNTSSDSTIVVEGVVESVTEEARAIAWVSNTNNTDVVAPPAAVLEVAKAKAEAKAEAAEEAASVAAEKQQTLSDAEAAVRAAKVRLSRLDPDSRFERETYKSRLSRLVRLRERVANAKAALRAAKAQANKAWANAQVVDSVGQRARQLFAKLIGNASGVAALTALSAVIPMIAGDMDGLMTAMAAAPVAATDSLNSNQTDNTIMSDHNMYDMPDWIRYDDSYVYLQGRTFGVVVPKDDQKMYYTLLVPAGEHTSVDLDNTDSWEMLDVPVKGQKTRIKSLLEAVAEQDWREAARVTKSLTQYHAQILDVEVWSYQISETKSRFFKAHGKGHHFAFGGELSGQRRHCLATGIDHKLVKLGDVEAERLNEMIDELADEDKGVDEVNGHAIREDEGMATAFKAQVLPEYTKQGYVLVGGAPDSGLMLFVKADDMPGIDKAESSQRAAKIMLRGGAPMHDSKPGDSAYTARTEVAPSQNNVAAQLVDFESGEYGHRDGIFMVIKNSLMTEIVRRHGVEAAWSYQGHYTDFTNALMKGMVYSVGRDCPARDLKRLLADADVDVAVDVNVWNKVIDDGSRAGDIVELDPSLLWVMEADVRNDVDTVRVSAQAIERSGPELSEWLSGKMESGIEGFIEDITNGEFGEHVSPFSRMGKLLKAGIPAFKADKTKLQADLAESASLFMRKGVRTRGTSVRLFHDDDLSQDVTLDGQQIPGARVPESWGLEVGDRFVFLAYPALPALDEEGRNTCIFTCEVEETHAAPHIYLHGDVALAALRDEDGDKPVAILPEEGETVPAVGQARLELSTRLTDAEAKAAGEGAADKQATFRADVSDANSIQVRSERAFDVYMRLGAQVGTIDNRVTSIMLYLGDQVRSVPVPTGDEDATVFMAKCIQASIESMKHLVDEAYSAQALSEWSKEVTPEAWKEDENGVVRFQHHPALTLRKPSTGGETTIREHYDALVELGEAVKSGDVSSVGHWGENVAEMFRTLPLSTISTDEDDELIVPAVDESVFMNMEEFNGALATMYEAASSMFEDERVFDAATAQAEGVYDAAVAHGRHALQNAEDGEEGLKFWEAQTQYLRAASMRLRFDSTPAEVLALSVLFLHAAPKNATGSKLLKVAVHAADRAILELFGEVITGDLTADDVLSAMGLDGRNTIRGDFDRKVEQYERNSKRAASAGSIRVPLKDTSGIEVGDKVVAGAPGIKQIRFVTLSSGENRWMTDKAQKNNPFGDLLACATYTVKAVDGGAVTLG